MSTTRRVTLTFGLAVATASPSVGQDRFELPLSSLVAHSDASPKLSFGSVGIDSYAGDSRPERHNHFDIPAERSFRKVPGVWLRIPLGN